MRILHVIMELRESNGGPPRGLANLARAQAACGDQVSVLPCRKTPGSQTIYPGVQGNLTCFEPPTDAALYWYNAALKHAVREYASGQDIVHIHGTWRYHVLAAAAAARNFGIPYVVRPAGNLGEVSRGHKSLRKRVYFSLLERPAVNRASAIHCCSDKEYKELEGLGLGPRRFVVPQPIDLELLGATPDLAALKKQWPQLPADGPIVLFLGRICAVKRLHVLAEAFVELASSFPEWHLVIAGPHEDAAVVSRLQNLAQAAGLTTRIWLPGMVTGSAKAALLQRASVFAQPSGHENFGMSVAEALMFGLPCVISEGVALAAEAAEFGAAVCTPSEVEPFADGLRRLLGEAAFRKECSIRARELVQRYSPQSVASALRSEYLKCLAA